jgi:hypothetical protein
MRVQPEGTCLFRVGNRGKLLGGYVVGTSIERKMEGGAFDVL